MRHGIADVDCWCGCKEDWRRRCFTEPSVTEQAVEYAGSTISEARNGGGRGTWTCYRKRQVYALGRISLFVLFSFSRLLEDVSRICTRRGRPRLMRHRLLSPAQLPVKFTPVGESRVRDQESFIKGRGAARGEAAGRPFSGERQLFLSFLHVFPKEGKGGRNSSTCPPPPKKNVVEGKLRESGSQ